MTKPHLIDMFGIALLTVAVVFIVALLFGCAGPDQQVATAAPQQIHPSDPPPICGMSEKDMLASYGGGFKLNAQQFQNMARWIKQQNDGELPGHAAYVVKDGRAFVVVFVEEGCAVLAIAPFTSVELEGILTGRAAGQSL